MILVLGTVSAVAALLVAVKWPRLRSWLGWLGRPGGVEGPIAISDARVLLSIAVLSAALLVLITGWLSGPGPD